MSNILAQFDDLNAVPNAIAGLVFVGALAFVVIYGTQSKWRTFAPGRALMYWVASFALLILMNTIHLATGPYPGIEFVRIFVYSTLLLSVWRLVFALLAILRQGEQIDTDTFIQKKDADKK